MPQLEKIGYAIVLSGIVLLVFTCHERKAPTVVQEATEMLAEKPNPMTKNNPEYSKISETTRVALIEPCGSCHQSSLDTHKAGAIAIFDLDQGEQWHLNLKQGNLEGLLGRTKSNSAISEEEYAAIEEFVAQKRAELSLLN